MVNSHAIMAVLRLSNSKGNKVSMLEIQDSIHLYVKLNLVSGVNLMQYICFDLTK